MASITTWTRLEPRPRTDDMAPSLEGRIYDPAWLLGRQWQVGEFVGDDAGSPVHAELKVVSSPLATYQSGTAKPIACGQLPLDVFAGAEPREVPFDARANPEPRFEMTLFESAEAGAQLMTFLVAYGCTQAGIDAMVKQNPLPAPKPGTADAQGVSYLNLLSGRLPDAHAIRQAIDNGTVPSALGIPANDSDKFLKAASDWIKWLDGLMLRSTADRDAWVDASLDHQFTVGVSQPASTTANVSAGSVTLPINSIAGIVVGMSVSGPNIPSDTTVVEESAASVALTQAVSAQVPRGSNVAFGAGAVSVPTNADAPAGSITLPFASTEGIAVGMSVAGTNIPNGTTVAALTVSVRLSAAVSAELPQGSNIFFAIALVAPAWDGERTDWYDLDADPTLNPPIAPSAVPPLPGVDAVTGSLTIAGAPAPLSYPGMPPRRWWDFDEGHVNFAQIDAAKDDLARMLVVEFACVYGNDWYLWPLRLPVASLNVVQTLEVTNTFGETIAIGPIGSNGGDFSTVSDWCLFRSALQTRAGSALNALLLPAALPDEQRSEPIEDVMFMRDEVAELAWAIECIVTGSDGRPLDRHSAAVADSSQVTTPTVSSNSDSAPLRYQLQTSVPSYWFPLVPDPDPNKSLFNRFILSDGKDQPILPAGSILRLRPGQQVLAIRQAEVPREGAEVRRNYRSVRGVDGAVLLWSARSKRAGRGQGSSGLRYDSALG